MSGGFPAVKGNGAYKQLASYQRCIARIKTAWPMFTARRLQRLRQGLFDTPVEKVAENIVEDLFTTVLDWSLDDVNLQINRADVVLSDNGYKRLVLEVKRPGSLIWHRQAAQAALDQALGYASAQNVAAVAVSDGNMLYAADTVGGGMRDRLLVALDTDVAPLELWWVSVHGIYRPCSAMISDLAWPAESALPVPPPAAEGLRDRKYHRPSWCFGYVGDPGNVDTWKLPYLLEDGAPDTRRLPKAIQSLFSNYRGEQVKAIPREAVPDVLVRLATAAATLRKLPCQCADPSPAYVQAHHALEQFGRLTDVKCCS